MKLLFELVLLLNPDLWYYLYQTLVFGLASLLFFGLHRLARAAELRIEPRVAYNDPVPALLASALLVWTVASFLVPIARSLQFGEEYIEMIRTILSTINSALFLWAAVNMDLAPERLAKMQVRRRRIIPIIVAGVVGTGTLILAKLFWNYPDIWKLPEVAFSTAVLVLFSWVVVTSLRIRTNRLLWVAAFVPTSVLLLLQVWEVVHYLLPNLDSTSNRLILAVNLAAKTGFVFTLFLLAVGYLKHIIGSLRPTAKEMPSKLEFLNYVDPNEVTLGDARGRPRGDIRICIAEREFTATCTLNAAPFKDLLTFAVARMQADYQGWLSHEHFSNNSKTRIKKEFGLSDPTWLFDNDRYQGTSRLRFAPNNIFIEDQVRSHSVYQDAIRIVEREIRAQKEVR